MGQYFKLVNVSMQEYVSLPGAMKARERLTNPVAMSMVGYLLFEGPIDGTGFGSVVDDDDPRVEQAIEDKIEQEKIHEQETFERYYEERPSYIISQFERKFSAEPDEMPENFEQFCREQAQSTYRDEDDGWLRGKLKRVALASYEISEMLTYGGRWAGDDVRLVGDYAENDYYHAAKPVLEIEFENGETIDYRGMLSPIQPESRDRDDIEHAVLDRDLEVGDMVQAKDEDGEYQYGHVRNIRDSEWTDITDGLEAEIKSFVGTEYVEANNQSAILKPDMVLSV